MIWCCVFVSTLTGQSTCKHPYGDVQAALDVGIEIPQVSAFMGGIGLNQIIELIRQSAVENPAEVETDWGV